MKSPPFGERRPSRGVAKLAVAAALALTVSFMPFSAIRGQAGTAGHNIDGTWSVEFPDSLVGGRTIDGWPEPMAPADGGPIPFQPWNAAIHAGSIAQWKSNVEWAPNNQHCLVAGTLRAMKGNFAWRMIETKEQVTVLFEEDNRTNIFRFADHHPADMKPTWTGDAIAHWTGDTLVVDMAGFNGQTPLPASIFITRLHHEIHRFRLLPGGQKMEDRVTIDDPGAFTKSFDVDVVFDRVRPGYKLGDYRCAENNQDLPSLLPWWPVNWGPG